MAATPPIQLAALKGVSPRRAVAAILAGSVAALALLLLVIYGHGRTTSAPGWVHHLPVVNASLNATSAAFIVLGLRAIRRRDLARHARHMLGALGSSSLFLVSYIVYHAVHGDSKFHGQGVIRPIYFAILISHVVLSTAVLPLIFTSFYLSLSGRLPAHRRVSRYTLPVWLYVSVTGVLVFALLRGFG